MSATIVLLSNLFTVFVAVAIVVGLIRLVLVFDSLVPKISDKGCCVIKKEKSE